MFEAKIFSTEKVAYSYEKNDSSGETSTIEGNTCYFMTNMDRARIVWIKGTVVYSVDGDINKDDLTKMVSSIYKGEAYK
jgi:hypothetical protein